VGGSGGSLCDSLCGGELSEGCDVCDVLLSPPHKLYGVGVGGGFLWRISLEGGWRE